MCQYGHCETLENVSVSSLRRDVCDTTRVNTKKGSEVEHERILGDGGVDGAGILDVSWTEIHCVRFMSALSMETCKIFHAGRL